MAGLTIAVTFAGLAALASCRGGGGPTGASPDATAAADANANPNVKPNANPNANANAAPLAFDAEPYRGRARVPALSFAAVTRDGREPLAGAVGRTDVARDAHATIASPFEAASIGKTVIAACVMQLVEEHALDLDADVSTYVGFDVRHPASNKPITLRLLLAHRSSIRDLDAEIGTGGSVSLGDFLRRELVAGAAPRRASFLDAGPGAEARYSNLGASLAAYAVERVAGEPFAVRSARRVFEPLGMKDTSWSARGAAVPYRSLADGGFEALPQASHAVYPSVDLRSTARDLSRYARAMLRGGELDGARVLASASVAAMHDGGLGWQKRTLGGRAVVGHEGEDSGASTGLFLDLAAGAGAVVLANGDAFASGDRARAAAVNDLLADLLREAVASRK